MLYEVITLDVDRVRIELLKKKSPQTVKHVLNLLTWIIKYGVDVIFGIPGVHNLTLYQGLADSTIRHVQARHEQGAGFMADGYARITSYNVCYTKLLRLM